MLERYIDAVGLIFCAVALTLVTVVLFVSIIAGIVFVIRCFKCTIP
jgi:hypothetical protein